MRPVKLPKANNYITVDTNFEHSALWHTGSSLVTQADSMVVSAGTLLATARAEEAADRTDRCSGIGEPQIGA